MPNVETRPGSEAVDVEIKRGLLGLRKTRTHLEVGEKMEVDPRRGVQNWGSYFWVREEGLEGRSIRIERRLLVSKHRGKSTYKDRHENFFPYHIPSGMEIVIKTPSMRVKVNRP